MPGSGLDTHGPAQVAALQADLLHGVGWHVREEGEQVRQLLHLRKQQLG